MGSGLTIVGFSPGTIGDSSFQDDAIAANVVAPATATKLTRGLEVVRAAAALPQTNTDVLFTVTGGRVLLVDIIGKVTVQVGAVANATKLTAVATDICGTVEMNAAAVGDRLSITGTFADAMIKTAVGVPLAPQATTIVLDPGDILVDCAGNDGGGGRVEWTLHYIPLEAAARVVAA